MGSAKPSRHVWSALWLVVVFGLCGCGPQVDLQPLELHAVPLQDGEGWRVDAFVKLQVTVPGAEATALVEEQFMLLTTAGEIHPGRPETVRQNLPRLQSAIGRYESLPLLKSRKVSPVTPTSAWLRFPNVLRLGRFGYDPREAGAMRHKLLQGLAELQPELAYQQRSGTIRVSLERFTVLPDPLPLRPSKLCDKVEVLDLPGGLNGFNLAVLEDRLFAADLGLDDKVLLLVAGPVDPCLSEWWPLEPGQATEAKLELAQVPAAGPPDGPMASQVMWQPMTRANPLHILHDEPAAVSQLMQGAEHEPLMEQWRASDDPRLRQIGVAAIRHQHPEAVTNLLQFLGNDPDPDVRIAAVNALVQVGPEHFGDQAEAVAKALGQAAESSDTELRQAVLRAAIALNCPGAVLATARKLLGDAESSDLACRVLGAAKDKASVPPLVEQASSGSRAATDALAAIGDASVLPEIRELLRSWLANPHQSLVNAGSSIDLLARLGTPADGDLLAALWADDRPPSVRNALLEGMGKLGGPAALAKLLEVADSDQISGSTIRRTALKALRRFRDDRAIPLWEKYAADSVCREACLDGLVYHGGDAAVAALKRLAAAEDRMLRSAAERALGEL